MDRKSPSRVWDAVRARRRIVRVKDGQLNVLLGKNPVGSNRGREGVGGIGQPRAKKRNADIVSGKDRRPMITNI